MLEDLADIELLKDTQIVLHNMIECVRLGVINIYDYLNGGSLKGVGEEACVELLKAVPRRHR